MARRRAHRRGAPLYAVGGVLALGLMIAGVAALPWSGRAGGPRTWLEEWGGRLDPAVYRTVLGLGLAPFGVGGPVRPAAASLPAAGGPWERRVMEWATGLVVSDPRSYVRVVLAPLVLAPEPPAGARGQALPPGTVTATSPGPAETARDAGRWLEGEDEHGSGGGADGHRAAPESSGLDGEPAPAGPSGDDGAGSGGEPAGASPVPASHGGPLVAIFHTHTSESFVPDLVRAAALRGGLRAEQAFTDDQNLNIVRAGLELATRLREGFGVAVVHETTAHDSAPHGRGGSYARSERTVRALLQQHPELRLIYDVHRDAIPRSASTLTAADGRVLARVAIVVGQGNGAQPQPNWRENWALARKLIGRLEDQVPGISRGILFKPFRYNQHLSPRLLLLEVGGPENTLEEVLATMDVLAAATARLLADRGPE